MISVGIIGTGGIADMHAHGILNEGDTFCLRSACDSSTTNLHDFGKRYGITELFTDFREMIAKSTVEAVIITLPHHLHEETSVLAFAHGKHVLLEKPIARTLSEADAIIAAAAQAGKTLLIGLNERYDPLHRRIHDLVTSDSIGSLFCVQADHYQNFRPPTDSWWRSAEAVGGGCIIGSGIHRLDLLRWIVGDVEEVSAYQVYDSSRLEAEVACTAILRFTNGAIGSFLCNWGIHQHPYCESIQLSGRNGSIISDSSKEGFFLMSKKGEQEKTLQEIRASGGYDSLWLHFAKCITTGSVPLTSGKEGRKSLELVLAINEAATKRSAVKIPSY